MPSVSVIMPCYNASAHIADSIESVINQTLVDWELIICDDASTDDSRDIAKDYANRDSRINLVNNVFNKGAAGARNSCLENATGRYIAFLDADDLWSEKKLELQISFMKTHSLPFTYTFCDVIDEHGLHQRSYRAPKRVDIKLMRLANFIPCLTAIYDSKILGKVRQPEIKKRNDFALWLKILSMEQSKYAVCLPVFTAKYRANNYGLSSKKLDSLIFFRRCLVEFGKVPWFYSYFYCGIYSILFFVKSKFTKLYNLLIVKL